MNRNNKLWLSWICLVVLPVAIMAAPTKQLTDDEHWANFKVKFNKTYTSPAEEAERKAIFIDNLRFIEKHNSEGHSYTVGVNQFADMRPEEYRKNCCGFREPNQTGQ